MGKIMLRRYLGMTTNEMAQISTHEEFRRLVIDAVWVRNNEAKQRNDDMYEVVYAATRNAVAEVLSMAFGDKKKP